MAQQQAASPAVPPEPTPAAVDLTATPEFKAAVNEAVQQALAQFKTSLMGDAGDAKKPEGEDNFAFARQLAMAIGEVADQGTNRKRVAPEILAQRAEAHERCVALLMKARAEGKKPEYRLTSKVNLNEQLIEPFMRGSDGKPKPTVIRYSGMPNDAMVPLNDVAKAIYREYSLSIGSVEAERKAADRMWMTPEGVVIVGNGPARRALPGFNDTTGIGPQVEDEFPEELGIIDNADPRSATHRVLGTVAAPAVRNELPELSIGR